MNKYRLIIFSLLLIVISYGNYLHYKYIRIPNQLKQQARYQKDQLVYTRQYGESNYGIVRDIDIEITPEYTGVIYFVDGIKCKKWYCEYEVNRSW